MATSARTMEILLEHLSDIPTIRARKMFGEYAVYVEDKVVGFVCDDRLLLKITPASKSRVRTQATGKPYLGAKDYYHIDEHDWDDREYITELVTATADSLAAPKLKEPKVSSSMKVISFTSRVELRAWLQENHAISSGILVQLFKKSSGIEGASFQDLLEEGLCFGWSESQRLTYDEHSYLQKFTPRRTKGTTSSRNKKLIVKLEARGLMTKFGRMVL